MALIGELKKIKEGDQEKEEYLITFSNGTYQQLKDLKNFLIQEGLAKEEDAPEKVVGFAIAFLERIKEDKAKDNK